MAGSLSSSVEDSVPPADCINRTRTSRPKLESTNDNVGRPLEVSGKLGDYCATSVVKHIALYTSEELAGVSTTKEALTVMLEVLRRFRDGFGVLDVKHRLTELLYSFIRSRILCNLEAVG